jgi:hypothetical protein
VGEEEDEELDQMQNAFDELCMDIDAKHNEEEKKESAEVHPELEEARAKKRAE